MRPEHTNRPIIHSRLPKNELSMLMPGYYEEAVPADEKIRPSTLPPPPASDGSCSTRGGREAGMVLEVACT